MVFSSYLFLFYFLPLALLAYYAAPVRLRHLVLTLFSYVFYGWANPLFVILLLVSTGIDYFAGLVIDGERSRAPLWPTRRARAALILSVCSNLTLLGFFKYFNFGVDSFNGVVEWIGMPALGIDTALRITLPLGISFYTFQSMSYAIDLYRGDARAVRNFVDFACFVSMFPQLVAGPIIRFSEVADQLRSRTHTMAKVARGVAFFSLGLAKKVLLANPCGKVADVAFDAGSRGVIEAWYGAVAYAFQIYFDFSGYSDMAIGLGLMLGFVFPKNFDSPYKSASITEFWRRWHISLSTWLRDYLYRPLGGNRKGPARTYINLFIVMLLGGLWHGAAWNFVIWGAIHGTLLAAERAFSGTRDPAPGGVRFRPVKVAGTFVLVLIAWVFFRAPDLSSAVAYLGDMTGIGSTPAAAALLTGIVYQPYYLLTMAIAAAVTWLCPQTWDWTRVLSAPRAAVSFALLVLAVVALTTQAFNPFIYFIF
jgi:alginate O-acetyltransferase complex protein AlgI